MVFKLPIKLPPIFQVFKKNIKITRSLKSFKWLDAFDHEVALSVKEIDFVKRQQFANDRIKYNYAWYRKEILERRRNDYVRHLSKLFPNVELMILPMNDGKIPMPKNLLNLFPKLDVIHLVCFDRFSIRVYEGMRAYANHHKDFEMLVCGLEPSDLFGGCDDFCETVRFLAMDEKISLKQLGILEIDSSFYTMDLIDVILSVAAIQTEHGYEAVDITVDGIEEIVQCDNDIVEYMLECDFVEKIVSEKEWELTSDHRDRIIPHCDTPEKVKMIFGEFQIPVFENGCTNPICQIVFSRPELAIKALKELEPSILTRGN